MSTPSDHDCPFCGILRGSEPGTIIARDDDRRFAILQSIHPESVVHWLAVPYEHMASTEEFEQTSGRRFLELIDYAMGEARRASAEVPFLEKGFTLKIHFGSFETIPHPKVHLLAAE